MVIYFSNKFNDKSFNFSKNYIKKKFNYKIKKKYDVVIYFRQHKNKNVEFFRKIAIWLIKKKLKVICFGDQLKIRGLKNFGSISNSKSLKLIRSSRIGINSGENFYTFFMMDCLNNGTYVLCDKNTATEKKINKQILISNYYNFNKTCKKISDFLNL